jgi:hypothetical protein
MFWQVCSYNEQASSSRLSYLEAPKPLDRGDISVDLIDFSSINGPLRAVKGTVERDESPFDLTQRYDNFAVIKSKVLHRVNSPEATHAAGSR